MKALCGTISSDLCVRDSPDQKMQPRSFVMPLERLAVSPNHAVLGLVLPKETETAQHKLLEGLSGVFKTG